MIDCIGITGAIFGHKFRPRFDVGASNIEELETRSTRDSELAVEYLKACKPKVYVGDVCERCGHMIQRGPEP